MALSLDLFEREFLLQILPKSYPFDLLIAVLILLKIIFFLFREIIAIIVLEPLKKPVLEGLLQITCYLAGWCGIGAIGAPFFIEIFTEIFELIHFHAAKEYSPSFSFNTTINMNLYFPLLFGFSMKVESGSPPPLFL